MARVRAVDVFVQDGFVLDTVLANAQIYYYFNNQPWEYWGETYKDTFEIIFNEDGYSLSLQFAGRKITARDDVERSTDNEMTGGTIHGIFFDNYIGQQWNDAWAIQDIELSATDVTDAMATSSQKDDVALFKGLFAGDDTFDLSEYDDTALGYDGKDRMLGNGGNDALNGGKGNDVLKGGKGSDLLIAAKGNDKLDGGRGDDDLIGGKGNDKLIGGKGEDYFHFAEGDGADTLKDFEDDSDTVFLTSDLWSGDLTRKRVVKKFAVEEDGNVVLDFGDDSITINGLDDRLALVNDIKIVDVA